MPSSSILGPVAISELPAGVHPSALINALTHVIRAEDEHATPGLAAGDWRPWEG